VRGAERYVTGTEDGAALGAEAMAGGFTVGLTFPGIAT
jgi:hypothetical protein